MTIFISAGSDDDDLFLKEIPVYMHVPVLQVFKDNK